LAYIEAALRQFLHEPPSKPTHGPSHYNAQVYGNHTQMTDAPDTTPPLTLNQQKMLQRVVGKFLYYDRAVDPQMLHALSVLASKQVGGTQTTVAAMTHFLDFCATHPDARLRYTASEMILRVESDASYLTEPGAHSRGGGHHYLGNLADSPAFFNGAILNIAKILRNVLASAVESEIAALSVNTKEAVPLRTALEEMGHPQPATPVATDNTTAAGIMNKTVKQQCSKAIDMRFYWVRDRVDQGQFRIFWAPGKKNLADYQTKFHPTAHHRNMRPILLNQTTTADALAYLRGCVKTATKSVTQGGAHFMSPARQNWQAGKPASPRPKWITPAMPRQR
jgi:hypothetical protein